MKNKTLKIFDTTLRDGQQASGANLSILEKIKIAKLLDSLKVDVIEEVFRFLQIKNLFPLRKFQVF